MLRAAAAMIRERGYEEMSLSELADRLHVTKPTIYYYVGNKDQLLLEIKRYSQKEVLDYFREVERKDVSGYEKMRELIVFYLKAMTSDFGACFVLTMNSKMAKESQEEIVRGVMEGDRIISKILTDGTKDGSLSVENPKIAGLTIIGALNWTAFWFQPYRSLSVEKLADMQADILLEGIATHQQKEAPKPVRKAPARSKGSAAKTTPERPAAKVQERPAAAKSKERAAAAKASERPATAKAQERPAANRTRKKKTAA